MKRLVRKKERKVLSAFKQRRKKRRMLLAEWIPGNINDPNAVQMITDIMAGGGQIKIEYNNEWKTIEPYGWNSSKAGNVLLMCYKDTGEVRSYRLDRITDVQFDDSTIDLSMYGLDDQNEESQGGEMAIDGVEVPTLDDNSSEMDSNEGTESEKEPEEPFDNAIEILENVENNEQTPIENNEEQLPEVEEQENLNSDFEQQNDLQEEPLENEEMKQAI